MAIDTTYLDSDSDSIMLARPAMLSMANKLNLSVSVKDFGAVGDGVTDDTAAIYDTKLASTAVNFPAGNYRLNTYPNMSAIAKTIRGEGLVNLNWYHTSAIAWASFPSDTLTENIRFVCTEPKNGLRSSVETANRVTLRNCHFEGFNNGPINDPSQNAWGLYIKNAMDVTVDSCTFANNGNTDIAVVDNVDNLTIINPSNTTTGKVSFNLEPNTTKGVYGMNVIGGRFNNVYLQENDNQYYASKNIVFTGASIDTLRYDGSGVEFQNCAITALANIPGETGKVYGGQLVINNASLGKNLIGDPYFFDVIGSGVVAYWAVFLGGATTIARQSDADGKYLRINPTKAASSASVYPRTDITVTAGEILIVALRARADNVGTGVSNVDCITARWLTSGGATISDTAVKCCRTLVGTNSGWKTDVGVLVAPASAEKVRLFVGTSNNSVSLDVSKVGLYRPTLNVEGGNWAAVIGDISTPVIENEYQQSAFPTGSNGAGYFVGERIKNTVPVVGQPKAWVCTVAGAPGTWVSEGNL